MILINSNILITGGSLGIGKSLANLLKTKGCNVIITGRDEERLKKTSEEIGCDYITADHTNVTDLEKIYKNVITKFSKIDCIVNNAGIGIERKPIEDISMEDFYEIYNTNVFGVFNLTKRFIKIMKDQNYGNIINIGSTCTFDGYEGGSVYASSKSALQGLTKCWQLELSKYNIRVMLVHPGNVSTAWGKNNRIEEEHQKTKLKSSDVAQIIVSMLEQNENVFIPEIIISPLSTFIKNKPLFD
jgi:3-oxoacyl-[acyl-carrier protein] reductase